LVSQRFVENVYLLKKERKKLFPKSLMDATIQDGGTRERRDICVVATLQLHKIGLN